jgi:hypothetical protein
MSINEIETGIVLKMATDIENRRAGGGGVRGGGGGGVGGDEEKGHVDKQDEISEVSGASSNVVGPSDPIPEVGEFHAGLKWGVPVGKSIT